MPSGGPASHHPTPKFSSSSTLSCGSKNCQHQVGPEVEFGQSSTLGCPTKLGPKVQTNFGVRNSGSRPPLETPQLNALPRLCQICEPKELGPDNSLNPLVGNMPGPIKSQNCPVLVPSDSQVVHSLNFTCQSPHTYLGRVHVTPQPPGHFLSEQPRMLFRIRWVFPCGF